ncbi:MAG: ParB/RepB/Spo0J family partition protein [Spirochaetaceae bacterium]|nr:ParB/RepB/Spo0J family partition protein [Spirochaetaceae bacterium]
MASNAANKNRLGRGLSALLPDEAEEAAGADAGKSSRAGEKIAGGEILIAPEKLKANPGQPRKHFDSKELEELAASIKQHGIIQPIIVDKDDDGNFVIIAGERRSRAAALAGLKEVPVIIRSYSDQKRLEVALIENIHRTDLNPIEEAAAYKQLMETAGLSQDDAAERVGKNRSTVANTLRLLKLPSRMKEALEEGSLSAGHARAILSLSKAADQEKLFVEIKEQGLSVRAAEKRAAIIAAEPGADKAGNSSGNAGGKGGKNAKRAPELKTMEEQFIRTLGTKVTISGNLKRGRIEIEYYSMDDLDRLYGLLER